jgi:hypothetical protein
MSERVAYATPGPMFLRAEDGTVLFQYVNDPRTVIGPRPATRRDQEAHKGAWDAFLATEGLGALDRNANGEDGGSLPAPEDDAGPTKAQIVAELREAGVKFNVRAPKAELAELLARAKG